MAHPHSNLTRQIDNIEIDIASLAAVTGVVGLSRIDASRANGFRTVAQKGIITCDGTYTTTPTGGPVAVGFTNASHSLAEIEESIENDPQSRDDLPAEEQAGRKIYWLGYLSPAPNAMGQNWVSVNLRHKATVIEGQSLTYFAYNTDLNTAIPAASQIKIFVEHLGVWLRD